MCECDRELGKRLPHQVDWVRPDGTLPDRIPVTLGFVARVCPTCRGESEQPFPKADGYGSPSLIERYYWREIGKSAFLMQDEPGFPPPEAWKAAKLAIQTQHEHTPRYDITSHARGSPKAKPEEVVMVAAYEKDATGLGRWRHGEALLRVEELVAARLSEEGWDARICERHLPASLFAMFAGPVMVGDAGSSGVPSFFGARDRSGRQCSLIFLHPAVADVHAFIDTVDVEGADLAKLWEQSSDYREYLWAHEAGFFKLVQWFVDLVPEKVRDVLHYLADDYWSHQTGWPDLFARRGTEYCFLEVKSPGDRFSEDQIRWVNDNHSRLGLPLKVVRVRRQ